MGRIREHHSLVVRSGVVRWRSSGTAEHHWQGVPTRTGSIAELNLMTERPVTVEEVNDAFRKAAAAQCPPNSVWPEKLR
jgi:hypothetical protein